MKQWFFCFSGSFSASKEGDEMIEDLVKLMKAKIPMPNYELLVNMKVVPMTEFTTGMPLYVMMCDVCEKKNMELTFEEGRSSLKVDGVSIYLNKVQAGDFTFYAGMCKKCNRRVVMVLVEDLKKLAYKAVFGEWPNE